MFKIEKRKSNSDATIFYMDIIKKSVIHAGFEAKDMCDLNESKNNDVVALSAGSLYSALKKKPKSVSVWFQGIDPEEWMKYVPVNRLKKLERYLVLSFYEWYALRKAKTCFFVSHRMLDFYRKKYGYKGNNYIIMPCFNDQINKDAFSDDKYSKPTFVYAGNLAGWQCFPKIIALYKQIKERIKDAELTIYTPDQDQASAILKEYGVDAVLKYVPYTQLAEEIKNFKYGFLIRDDHPVNNVATPTKMGNYLANGIIPIFSDVIGDFKDELSNLRYSVPLGQDYEGLKRLFELESSNISGSQVFDDYQKVFKSYYSVEHYVDIISKYLIDNK